MLTEIYQNCPSYGDSYPPIPVNIFRCPSYRGVRLIESFNVTKNGRDQTKYPS